MLSFYSQDALFDRDTEHYLKLYGDTAFVKMPFALGFKPNPKYTPDSFYVSV